MIIRYAPIRNYCLALNIYQLLRELKEQIGATASQITQRANVPVERLPVTFATPPRSLASPLQQGC